MASVEQDLHERWQRTCHGLGLVGPEICAVFDDLVSRYTSPDRHYHNLDHIVAMLDVQEELARRMDVPHPEEVSLAVWFHDVIYDTRAPDNEEQSAAYAAEVLQTLGISGTATARVERLILATKTHLAHDQDAEILLDADLAILGADAAEYDRYAEAIRREYAYVPDDQWRPGRAAVLERFLQRPQIYITTWMFGTREQAARRNLVRERDALV